MDILIAGFGVVGQGLAEVIRMKGERLRSEFGRDLRIVGAFDSTSVASSVKGLDPDGLLSAKAASGKVGDRQHGGDTLPIVREMDYDVLIELTPTIITDPGPGFDHIRCALRRGKDVITCNKGPLALKFRELTRLSEKHGSRLRFEGAVGGAMPVVNLSREILKGETVLSIRGILNGTCNFILHRMFEEGLPLRQALREAQEIGIAERDPSYDIDGVDSACKVAILANAIMGMDATYRDVRTVGIRGITEEAVALAAEQKKVIRLIGEVTGKRMEVSPRLVPMGHPLSVGGTLNMVQIKTDIAGEITVAGKGAGKMETASAVLSDLVAIMKENALHHQ